MQDIMNKHHISDDYHHLMHNAIHDPEVNSFIKKNHVSNQTIINSASKLYEYFDEKKKLVNGKQTLIPGYVPKLVMNDNLIDITYVPTRDTVEKQHTDQLQNRVQSISMPKMIRNANLDDFDSDSTTERTMALGLAVDFISNYTKRPKHFHRGLYLYGKFGIGKTYLLAAIANRLASKGYRTMLVHFPSFAADMKNSIANNDVGAKLDRVKTAPILMLDDLGADSISSWIRDDILAVILEYRMQNELPTFFSSNDSMKKLETDHLRIDKAGNDEPLKAKRIMQRIHFLSREFLLTGKNRRLGNKDHLSKK